MRRKNQNQNMVYYDKDGNMREGRPPRGIHIITRPLGRLILKIAAVVIVALIVFAIAKKIFTPKTKTTIITESQLEKVVNINELSTYKITYNGICRVNEDGGTSPYPAYYVSYNAYANVGIDTSLIDIKVDKKTYRITVTLPEIQINDIVVDAGSLEYIFENDDYETMDVSKEALKECEADVRAETDANADLKELARTNTENMVRALIEPLAKNQNKKYTVVFE